MKRVQMRRGVKLPWRAKYVGRPTRWGNPVRIGETLTHPPSGAVIEVTRGLAVSIYHTWAEQQIAADPEWLEPLRGRDLACWCPLDVQCHADVLFALVVRER